MAIYHFSVKVISRRTGRSATAAAAYRGALRIEDRRTGEIHDYGNRKGVLSHDILHPSRTPEEMRDAAGLWNAVELYEKRKDARLARENTVALPHELSHEQNRELLHGFVQEAYVKRGMAAQVNIHAADAQGDHRNLHAHVMLTTRGVTRNGFKEQKARNWDKRETLNEWRALWADHVNQALERAGIEERVTEKSFKDLGIEKAPSKHLGPEASGMERRGEDSRIGNENRAAQEHNQKLAALAAQKQAIETAIKAEALRLAEEKRLSLQAEMEEERIERTRRMKHRDPFGNQALEGHETAFFSNWRAQEKIELLDTDPKFWDQVFKEYDQRESDIRSYYDIEGLRAQLEEAKERTLASDHVNGRFSGEHDAAVHRLAELQMNLADATARQAEALEKSRNEREMLRAMREERAEYLRDTTREAVEQARYSELTRQFEARQGEMEREPPAPYEQANAQRTEAAQAMNEKLSRQFEAQQGGMEQEAPEVSAERDRAGFSANDNEAEHDRGIDHDGDDVGFSR